MRVALLLGSVLLMSACSSDVPVAKGAAAPVTAAPASSSAPAPPSPADPADAPTDADPTSAEPSAANRSAPPRGRPSGPRVLGPTGFGAVKLLQSERQATASGLVEAFRVAGPCRYAPYKADGDAGVSAADRGVMMIDAYGNYSTPEGVVPGDNWSDAKRTYPGIAAPLGGDINARNGIGEVQVPGNAAAIYRITWAADKVTKIQLWHKDNTCYE